MVLYEATLFLLAITVLFIFGSLLVKSSVKVAQFLKLSEFVAGFIVLAIATSLPELLIGVQSALAGNPALSLGNVIGSNIANLALIGGIIAVLARKVSFADENLRKDTFAMAIVTIFPLVLMVIGKGLSRTDGIILLATYIFYNLYLWNTRSSDGKIGNHVTRLQGVIHTVLFIASLYLLNYTAQIVVQTAELIALELALPAIFVGLIFVALGTSLPELALSARAIAEKHTGLSIGNIIGSCVVNSLLVLGITAVIAPITANLILFFTSAIFLLFVVISFTLFAFHSKNLSWHEGIVLIMFYILFIIIELNIKEFFLG
jgi:cation:H+ antiporter